MYIRLLLSVGILACLGAVDNAAIPVNNSTQLLLRAILHSHSKEYDGVYIFKDGQSRKLFDDASAINIFRQPHLMAYIGGKDGLYLYDDSTEKLEKYGTIDGRIIGIAKANVTTDTLYILTEDNSVYKVTEGGTKKTKVEGVEGAQSIELDWDDNLYFIGADDQPYVVTADGVKKIQGLPPKETHFAILLKTPDIVNGINLNWNSIFYYIFSDGTSRLHELTEEDNAKIEETRRFIHMMSEHFEKRN